MKQLAIDVQNLGKRYSISAGGDRADTLRDAIAGRFMDLFGGRRRSWSAAEFWALQDATFQIERGERVGIIGLNGAGKSTLLKLLSRIVEPTTGIARIAGRVGALLEVGTGFHFELSGRENVYLYGAILGMSKAEVSRKFRAIADFSGVEQFMDVPVKRYSSGMYVRLTFAVAAHLEPEILLVDEVLSVGDLPFQRKCMEFAQGLQQGNATILFVSHNMFSIKTMCDRVIYLKQGRILFDGPTDIGIGIYEDDCRLGALPWINDAAEDLPVRITDFSLHGDAGAQKTVFNHGERMRLRMSYEARTTIERPNFIVAFVRSDGVACCNYVSALDGVIPERMVGNGVIELETPPLKLVANMYTVQIIVRENSFDQIVGGQIGSSFHIRHGLLDTHFGVFHESGEWHWDADVDMALRKPATRLASRAG